MCGRTACTLDPEYICQACAYKDQNGQWSIPIWKDAPDGHQYYPSYNMAPTRYTPVMISKNHIDENCEQSEEKIIQPMYWSLIPSWHKGELKDFGFANNNARLETIMEKKMFSTPLKKGRRCIVLADGYYEWQKMDKKEKQPYFIYFPQPNNVKVENQDWKSWEDGAWEKTKGWKGPKLLTMAGIFDIWHNPKDNTELYSYAVVTRDAASELSFIHDRMPVILDGQEEINNWLDFDRLPYQTALQGLNSNIKLIWHPVSKVVGNSSNNTPECIQPINLSVKLHSDSKSSKFMQNWLKKESPSKGMKVPKRKESPERTEEKTVKKERLD